MNTQIFEAAPPFHCSPIDVEEGCRTASIPALSSISDQSLREHMSIKGRRVRFGLTQHFVGWLMSRVPVVLPHVVVREARSLTYSLSTTNPLFTIPLELTGDWDMIIY